MTRSSYAWGVRWGEACDGFRGFGRGAPVGEQPGGRLRRRDPGAQGRQPHCARRKDRRLLGADGAGKTTLLLAITGLLDVGGGEFTDVGGLRRHAPAGAGNYSGTPNEIVVRQSRIAKPDNSAPSGVTEIEPFFVGPTAKEFKLEKPCYQ
jgi:hypothetical protein